MAIKVTAAHEPILRTWIAAPGRPRRSSAQLTNAINTTPLVATCREVCSGASSSTSMKNRLPPAIKATNANCKNVTVIAGGRPLLGSAWEFFTGDGSKALAWRNRTHNIGSQCGRAHAIRTQRAHPFTTKLIAACAHFARAKPDLPHKFSAATAAGAAGSTPLAPQTWTKEALSPCRPHGRSNALHDL